MANEAMMLIQWLLLAFGFVACDYLFCASGLVVYFITMVFLANFLVLDAVPIMGVSMTACDGFAVMSMITLNVLREYYHVDHVTMAMKQAVIFLMVTAVFLLTHLGFSPSSANLDSGAYRAIIMPMTRTFIISLLVWWISQQLDNRLFQYVKQQCPKWTLSVRILLCMAVAEAVDTLLFTLMALDRNRFDLFWVFVLSYSAKMVVGVFFVVLRPWLWSTKSQDPVYVPL